MISVEDNVLTFRDFSPEIFGTSPDGPLFNILG